MEKEKQSKLQLVTAWTPVFRNILLLALGSMIAVQQTFLAASPNLYLLAFAATLLGIPFFLKLDQALSE